LKEEIDMKKIDMLEKTNEDLAIKFNEILEMVQGRTVVYNAIKKLMPLSLEKGVGVVDEVMGDIIIASQKDNKYKFAKSFYTSGALKGEQKSFKNLLEMEIVGKTDKQGILEIKPHLKNTLLPNDVKTYVRALELELEKGRRNFEGFELLKEVSENLAMAKIRMIRYYEKGAEHLEKNHEKAFKLAKSLEDQRHPEVNFRLGKYYIKGIGTEKDFEEGKRLLELAVEEGHDKAIKLLSKVSKKKGKFTSRKQKEKKKVKKSLKKGKGKKKSTQCKKAIA
jgi:hypothetical protein